MPAGRFGNKGCKGGWMNNAFRYLRSVKGSQTERSYPYKARVMNYIALIMIIICCHNVIGTVVQI